MSINMDMNGPGGQTGTSNNPGTGTSNNTGTGTSNNIQDQNGSAGITTQGGSGSAGVTAQGGLGSTGVTGGSTNSKNDNIVWDALTFDNIGNLVPVPPEIRNNFPRVGGFGKDWTIRVINGQSYSKTMVNGKHLFLRHPYPLPSLDNVEDGDDDIFDNIFQATPTGFQPFINTNAQTTNTQTQSNTNTTSNNTQTNTTTQLPQNNGSQNQQNSQQNNQQLINSQTTNQQQTNSQTNNPQLQNSQTTNQPQNIPTQNNSTTNNPTANNPTTNNPTYITYPNNIPTQTRPTQNPIFPTQNNTNLNINHPSNNINPFTSLPQAPNIFNNNNNIPINQDGLFGNDLEYMQGIDNTYFDMNRNDILWTNHNALNTINNNNNNHANNNNSGALGHRSRDVYNLENMENYFAHTIGRAFKKIKYENEDNDDTLNISNNGRKFMLSALKKFAPVSYQQTSELAQALGSSKTLDKLEGGPTTALIIGDLRVAAITHVLRLYNKSHGIVICNEYAKQNPDHRKIKFWTKSLLYCVKDGYNCMNWVINNDKKISFNTLESVLAPRTWRSMDYLLTQLRACQPIPSLFQALNSNLVNTGPSPNINNYEQIVVCSDIVRKRTCHHIKNSICRQSIQLTRLHSFNHHRTRGRYVIRGARQGYRGNRGRGRGAYNPGLGGQHQQ